MDPSHLPVRYLAMPEGSKPPRGGPLPSSCAEDRHADSRHLEGPRPTLPVPAPHGHHLRETKHHHHHQRASSKSVTQSCGAQHHHHPSSPHSESEVTNMITRRKAQQRGEPPPECHPAACPFHPCATQRGPWPGPRLKLMATAGAPWTPPAEQCFHCSSCIVKQRLSVGTACAVHNLGYL